MAVVLPSANGSILEEIEFEGRVGERRRLKSFAKKNTTNTEKEKEQKPTILFGHSHVFFAPVMSFRET